MMFCAACNKDVHPQVDGDQSGKFVHRCSCGQFLANITPPWEAKPTDVQELRPAPEPDRKPSPVAPKATAPAQQLTIEEQIRARLAYLEDGHVESEQAERRKLRRMLSAGVRQRRARSNVVPMQRASK
jgi:hypothetical protein